MPSSRRGTEQETLMPVPHPFLRWARRQQARTVGLHQLACGEQCSHLLRARRLSVHWSVPSQPQQLSGPRASRRSVFTVIADNTAFTCRVSSSTVSKAAPTSPVCSPRLLLSGNCDSFATVANAHS